MSIMPDHLLPILSEDTFNMLEETPWEDVCKLRHQLYIEAAKGTISILDQAILEGINAYYYYYIDKLKTPQPEPVVKQEPVQLEFKFDEKPNSKGLLKMSLDFNMDGEVLTYNQYFNVPSGTIEDGQYNYE